MDNRIIEITSDGIYLSALKGFLLITKDGKELGRVGLPDIGALIVRGHGATISLNLVTRLADSNIPLVLCGPDQSPSSIVWPLKGHHNQGHIIEYQSQLSKPQKKRIWQTLISAKITAQAQALDAEGLKCSDLYEMAKRVLSGDPDNQEATAARKYWPRMIRSISPNFKRDQSGNGINNWLNYGYAVLRASTARSILSAGLHPSLSIYHKSRGEALRLTSDLMEPFRPWIDLSVRRLIIQDSLDGDILFPELNPSQKSTIVKTLSLDLKGPYGASPLQTCIDRLCKSLASICMNEGRKLELPKGLFINKDSTKV